MGLPVELGDVPGWIGAGTGVVNLFRGVGQRRQQQAREWGELVDELAGLDPEELRRVVQDNPVVAEVVGVAWEEAARTAAENKRRLLAEVAAAALRRDTTPAKIDALPLLLRTVIALDSPHIALLTTISETVDRFGRLGNEAERRITIDKLKADWPGPSDLLGPVLGALERENLTETVRDSNGLARWVVVTDYGNRFIDYLMIDEGGWPPG